MKRIVGACIAAALLLAATFAPAAPWPARWQRSIRRFLMRAELRLAALRGQQPRQVSITGKLLGHGAQVEALKGARITAVESTSGYSALSDIEGRFVLPHLMWYPGASYNLSVNADAYHSKLFKITTASDCPAEDILDIGVLRFDDGYEAGEATQIRLLEYDDSNNGYYEDVFARLTKSLASDERKIETVNKFVATKLNYDERAASFKSPRQILERGSCFCSNLALAMAAITQAGGYPTRTIHLSDTPQYLNTHVVVEVYYGEQWHLYDPTYGVSFANRLGAVASYRELRLDADLVSIAAFSSLKPETVRSILSWMPDTYRAGFHQIYQVHKSESCRSE